MKKLTTLLTFIACILAFSVEAQVAINQDGTNADANSVLHVKDGSNNEALYIEAATGNVGIGTTTPTQELDINGDMRISGAIMPNNDAGTSGQLLISEGPGAAATWGAEMLNQSQTTAIGKFWSGLFNIPWGNNNWPGYFTLTLTDPNCVQTSTCFLTFRGPLPGGVNYSNLIYTIEAQNGQWVFYFKNTTGSGFTDMQFSFVAFY